MENYQTPEGVKVPEVLQPFMHGITFIPYNEKKIKEWQKKQAGGDAGGAAKNKKGGDGGKKKGGDGGDAGKKKGADQAGKDK